MVSVTESPAVSVALTRRVTSARAGAVKHRRNRPRPCGVTVAAWNVWPSLKDTSARALVIWVAGASWRWPTVRPQAQELGSVAAGWGAERQVQVGVLWGDSGNSGPCLLAVRVKVITDRFALSRTEGIPWMGLPCAIRVPFWRIA